MTLMTDRRFYPLFWTQFLGAFNDNFFKNALVILITFKASSVLGIPSSQMVALAGGIFILPFFIFSATSGQIADKYEKGSIIRIIKLAEIAIMVLAAYGFLYEKFSFLLLVLFLMGLHSTFFGPIKYSILPQHLQESELVAGNALVEAGTFLSILLGTIVGGVLVLHSASGPFYVSLGLIGVAIAGWITSLSIPQAQPVDPDLVVQWNPVPPTLSIFKSIQSNRAVFLSILGISWFWFFGASMLSLFPPYCKDVLVSDSSVVTGFLALFSVGIGLGSLLCGQLSRKRLELGLVPLGSIGMSIFCVDLFWVGIPQLKGVSSAEPLSFFSLLSHGFGVRIVFDLLLLSIFSGLFIVPLYTLIQERSEPRLRSRVIAANNILNAFFMVIASVLLVVLMKLQLTVPQIFLLLALLNAVVAIYIYTVLPEFFLRFVMWVLANVMYRMKVEGQENVPTQGSALIISNHVSFVDWMLLGAAIPRPVCFVYHQDFSGGWFIQRLLSRAKAIPIASKKENPELLEKAFQTVKKELESGELVGLFPEGKITYDGNINPFRPGMERILGETPVPVVPVAIRGMWGSFFSREGGRAIKKMPKRFWSRVTIQIGKPVAASEAHPELMQQKVKELLR